MKLEGREWSLAVRITEALEKLAQDPVVEMEVGPPCCPYCDRLNPTVRTAEQGEAEGPLFLFIVEFQCTHCEKVFYGMPAQWSMHTNQDTLTHEIAERAGIFNANQTVN